MYEGQCKNQTDKADRLSYASKRKTNIADSNHRQPLERRLMAWDNHKKNLQTVKKIFVMGS